MERLIKVLENWGPIAGWIAALLQLVIWIIFIPIMFYKKRKNLKEKKKVLEDLKFWQEEASNVKDKANGWYQITKQAILMMKGEKSKSKAYKTFTDAYGGEEKFKDMWTLPEIPKEEEG